MHLVSSFSSSSSMSSSSKSSSSSSRYIQHSEHYDTVFRTVTLKSRNYLPTYHSRLFILWTSLCLNLCCKENYFNWNLWEINKMYGFLGYLKIWRLNSFFSGGISPSSCQIFDNIGSIKVISFFLTSNKIEWTSFAKIKTTGLILGIFTFFL